MDEEPNNDEQNLMKQANDNIQDTKDAIKDSTNLAQNAVSGNYIGAVKDGIKLLGNKSVRKTILLAILIPIIIIVALASSLYSIYNTISDKLQEALSKVKTFANVDWASQGTITITDEAIENIIETIESTGIDLADLKLLGDIENPDKESEEYKAALKKYIKKFYEAQAVTETLNTNPNWFMENVVNSGKTYGAVCLYRAKNDDIKSEIDVEKSEEFIQLKYMEYNKMLEYANSGDTNKIREYFSVTEDNNKLIIPEWTITTVNNNTTTSVTLREIEYKNVISQYTTPMNFLIYLTMVSQNPEFVSEVTDLIKGSKIDLTIFDTKTISEEEENYTYTTHIKGSRIIHNVPTGEYDIDGIPITEDVVEPINESNNEEENTTTIVTTVIPTLKVTYVKTWFCEQSITYKKKEITPYSNSYTLDSSNDESLQDDPEPPDPEEGSTVEWITDRKKEVTQKSNGVTYEEDVRGDVIDKTDDFIKLLDKKYKIPNTKREEAAGQRNMISGAEWLFSLMQKEPGLQNLEQVMRYTLGKYAKKDYGVSSLDFSIFDAKDFNSVSGIGSLKSFIRYFEGTKEENGQYVVYKDSGGNRTVGYGVNIEAQKARFIARGIDPSTIKEGDKLDKEIIDSIEEEIINAMKSSVEATTSGMDLKSYQIIALVSRYYNCGNISGFRDAYNSYWNESDDEYGVTENNTMYEHSLYQKYMSTPIKDNKGNTLAGLVKRRKAEWILFKTGYNIATGSFVAEGGAIVEWAQTIHQYMEQNNYHYCVYFSNSGEECQNRSQCYLSNTFESSKTSVQTRKTCCATFVSWVLQEAGYLGKTECYNGATALSNVLENQKGFTRVSRSELAAGDIIVCDGHVEIYAGDNQVYNAGSGNAIRSASPNSKTNIYKCLYGLRAPQ